MKDNISAIWKPDSGHSTIGFKAKHLAIANVAGTFGVFTGSVQSDKDDFDGAHVTFKTETASLNTQNSARDTHLKSDLFFDVQQFPKISFSGILQKHTDEYELVGDLTIRDVTERLKLKTEFSGVVQGLFRDTRAGFELQGELNRKKYGLTWNGLTPAGGVVIGENIRIQIDLELIKVL